MNISLELVPALGFAIGFADGEFLVLLGFVLIVIRRAR